MIIAWMLLCIGVIALAFAGYFCCATDRIANRNVLDRRVDLFTASGPHRSPPRPNALEALLNQVYRLDERLVRNRTVTAVALLLAGAFLLVTGCALMRQ